VSSGYVTVDDKASEMPDGENKEIEKDVSERVNDQDS